MIHMAMLRDLGVLGKACMEAQRTLDRPLNGDLWWHYLTEHE